MSQQRYLSAQSRINDKGIFVVGRTVGVNAVTKAFEYILATFSSGKNYVVFEPEINTTIVL